MAYHTTPKITDWQRQVIMGTLLGGSSIVKPRKGNNCYLSMRGKNGMWIQCKAQEIGLDSTNPFVLESDKYFRWHSRCSPLFNEFRYLFYEGNKKVIRPEVLDRLRDIGLAVWFMDAGKIKDGIGILNVRNDVKVVSEYFSSIDISNMVIKNKIELTKWSTDKLIGVIGQFIPDFMIG